LPGFLVGSDKVSGLIHRIDFRGDKGDTLIAVMVPLLVIAVFFSFSLSLRSYNDLGLMAAGPVRPLAGAVASTFVPYRHDHGAKAARAPP